MSNQESLAKKQIWVFGAQCAEADRSIQWKDSYPNFADLDILIVNLTSLTIEICDSLDKRAYSQAQEMIWDKFCYGGTLIFITSSWHEHFPPKSRFFGKFECMIPAEKDSKNAKESYYYTNYPLYFLSPFDVIYEDNPVGNRIEYDRKNPFKRYLRLVKSYNFYIKFLLRTSLGNYLNLDRNQLTIKYDPLYKINDSAGRMIGGKFQINGAGCYGKVIFLPPPTNVPVEEGINLVIRDLKRKYANREPPHNVASDNISDKILSTANSSNKQLADKIQAKDKNETLGIFDKYGSSFSSYELLILAKKQMGKWKIITGSMTLSYAHRPEEDNVVHSIDEELIVIKSIKKASRSNLTNIINMVGRGTIGIAGLDVDLSHLNSTSLKIFDNPDWSHYGFTMNDPWPAAVFLATGGSVGDIVDDVGILDSKITSHPQKPFFNLDELSKYFLHISTYTADVARLYFAIPYYKKLQAIQLKDTGQLIMQLIIHSCFNFLDFRVSALYFNKKGDRFIARLISQSQLLVAP
jgi:hypothetical protein